VCFLVVVLDDGVLDDGVFWQCRLWLRLLVVDSIRYY